MSCNCEYNAIKVAVCKRDNYTVYLEQHVNGATFIHADYTKWNVDTKRQSVSDLDKILELHGGPLYALVDEANRKLERFVILMGFEPLSEFMDADNNKQYIYVRSK